MGELYPTLEGDAISTTIRMEVFSPNTNIPHRAIQGHSIGVDAVSFSPGGKVLAHGSVDGTIGIWNVSTGSLSHTLCYMVIH
ncbi:hypothetical protein BGZ57DRAFT_793798, partial [Hyaloscypha finlandica]